MADCSGGAAPPERSAESPSGRPIAFLELLLVGSGGVRPRRKPAMPCRESTRIGAPGGSAPRRGRRRPAGPRRSRSRRAPRRPRPAPPRESVAEPGAAPHFPGGQRVLAVVADDLLLDASAARRRGSASWSASGRPARREGRRCRSRAPRAGLESVRPSASSPTAPTGIGTAAQGADVGGGVAGAAGKVFLLPEAEDQDGRLAADPLGMADRRTGRGRSPRRPRAGGRRAPA